MPRPRKQGSSRRIKRRGVLTLEWIILITVIVIGAIGGLSAVRTATVLELNDLAEAISCITLTEEEAAAKAAEAAAETP